MSVPGKLTRGNGKADWKNGKARNGGSGLLKSDAIDRKKTPPQSVRGSFAYLLCLTEAAASTIAAAAA